MRRALLARRHALGDDAPHRRERHGFFHARRSAGRGVLHRAAGAQHVLGDDAAAGAAALQRGEVDVIFLGDAPRRGRGGDAAALTPSLSRGERGGGSGSLSRGHCAVLLCEHVFFFFLWPPLGWGGGGGGGALADCAVSFAVSPAAAITAMVRPTRISSPSMAVTFCNTPDAGASTSTVALSVSTSIKGSPFLTKSPGFLSQLRSVPFSCAMPSAGMMTSVAIFRRCYLQEDGRRVQREPVSVGFCQSLPGCSNSTASRASPVARRRP